MNANLEHDKSFISEFVGAVERSYGSSRQSQDCRFASRAFGHGKYAVDIVPSFVRLNFNIENIHFVVAFFLVASHRCQHGHLGRFVDGVAPELLEVGGHGGSGCDAVRVKGDIGHGAVVVTVDVHLNPHRDESRLLRARNIKVSYAVVVGFYRFGGHGIHFVGTIAVGDDGIFHSHVLLDGKGGEMCCLSSSVGPVVMVGFGHYGNILVT